MCFAMALSFAVLSCNPDRSAESEEDTIEMEEMDDIDGMDDDYDDMDDLEVGPEDPNAGVIETFDEFQEDLKDATSELKTEAENTYEDAKGRTVYTMVSDMPSYEGGDAAMFRYLQRNVKYPSEARNNNVEGTSYVQFIVDTDGGVDNVEVVKTSGDITLDEEAIRVVQSMPDWKPGMQNGAPVNVRYILPIKFQMKS